MTETRSPLEALNAFRKILLDERRQIISTALELREANGEGGLHGADLQRIQEQIEAVDRAIADETALQSPDL